MTSTTISIRTAETSVPLHHLLATRWSPRAFDPEHRLSHGEVAALLEAARWAPSASNSQPWRFLVAQRGDAHFALITQHLAPANTIWAWRASLLVLAAARQVDDEGRSLPWAMYDTGQAMSALTVQAHSQGLVVHQMGGFDPEGIGTAFNFDATLTPVVLAAIGRHDPTVELTEKLAERERAPRSRLPLESLLLQKRQPSV